MIRGLLLNYYYVPSIGPANRLVRQGFGTEGAVPVAVLVLYIRMLYLVFQYGLALLYGPVGYSNHLKKNKKNEQISNSYC